MLYCVINLMNRIPASSIYMSVVHEASIVLKDLTKPFSVWFHPSDRSRLELRLENGCLHNTAPPISGVQTRGEIMQISH